VTEPLPEGATPLDADEADELLPEHITTGGELNAWEQANILDAERWLLARRKRDVLTEAFVRELHRRMFGATWRWAGEFRRTNKNIGVDWQAIPVALRDVLADGRCWIEHGTYALPSAAVRFHHRLVQVHCFPNGNGRHARLCADALLTSHGAARMTWGAELGDAGEARTRYIAALRAADGGDYGPLLAFVGLAT
jgi:Fic-DOC domain mobile mystery protein B